MILRETGPEFAQLNLDSGEGSSRTRVGTDSFWPPGRRNSTEA